MLFLGGGGEREEGSDQSLLFITYGSVNKRQVIQIIDFNNNNFENPYFSFWIRISFGNVRIRISKRK